MATLKVTQMRHLEARLKEIADATKARLTNRGSWHRYCEYKNREADSLRDEVRKKINNGTVVPKPSAIKSAALVCAEEAGRKYRDDSVFYDHLITEVMKREFRTEYKAARSADKELNAKLEGIDSELQTAIDGIYLADSAAAMELIASFEASMKKVV